MQTGMRLDAEDSRPSGHALGAADGEQIISPFSQTTSTIHSSRTGSENSRPWWMVSMMFGLAIMGMIGFFVFKYLNDPYRTLEPFSVDKYLADFQPLEGGRFKADFKVEADLGWKDNFGRLMVFTAQGDTRPILVLIPPRLSAIFFTKGQMYQVALEVSAGGLIHANTCEKN